MWNILLWFHSEMLKILRENCYSEAVFSNSIPHQKFGLGLVMDKATEESKLYDSKFLYFLTKPKSQNKHSQHQIAG